MLKVIKQKSAGSFLSLGILSLATLSGAMLASSFVSASDVIDQVSIAVPVSCTMSGTGMTSHNAEIQNGTYTADIGTTTLHVFCNDFEGFAIYATGYTGNEIGATNSNKLVGASSNLAIDTGLATSAGNPDVSNWAMKLAITQGSGDTAGTNAFAIDSAPNVVNGADASFSQYHVVPNEYTKVAHKNTSTDMTANTGGVKLTTTYAAYISKTQPADTYSGQVKYTLVHPSDASNPGAISIEEAYSRAGKQKYNGYYKMQEMSGSICNMVTLYDEPSQTQLIDTRDNKVYYVAKLQDSNCWMTQNLDHDIVTTANYYTNQNTDIGWNSSTNSYDTATWTAEYATHTSGDGYWCDEADGSTCSTTAISSYDPGDYYWNGVITHDYNTNEISSSGNTHYYLGNYYNWNAAVATSDSGSVPDGSLVDRSICPAGWTLPRAGHGDDSFYNLLDKYGFTEALVVGNNTVKDAPLYFGMFGSISSSNPTTLSHIGLFGGFWSANLLFWDFSGGYAGYLNLSEHNGYVSSSTDELDGGGLAIGKSVRCIARPVSNTFVDPWE